MVTHGRIPTTSPFLAFHYGTMEVGNDVLGVQGRFMRVYCEFGLEEVVRNVGGDLMEHTLNM